MRPKEYSPAGFDGTVLKCETRKQSGELGGKPIEVEFSSCVWADDAAVGMVSQSGTPPRLRRGTSTAHP